MKLMIRLTDEECRALAQLAARERRDPRDQAALSVRRDLERNGVLSMTQAPNVAPTRPAQGGAA